MGRIADVRGMKALLTPVEVASLLRCSRKTLAAHVRTGALKYVNIGCGTKRPRRMFAEADVEEFIERQTHRDVPCQSTVRKVRRIATTTSGSEVIGFMALRERRNAEKRNAFSACVAAAAPGRPPR
jgi:excisionase family DNA binding protein